MTDRPTEVLAWAVATFGDVAKDRRERTMRFLEEAVELAHALDIDRETVQAICKRVWNRDKGYIPREIGQAQMTLEALAASIGHDADREASNEFDRVRKIPKGEWATRHAAKVAIGIAQPQPLPEGYEMFEGKPMKVLNGERSGWWRFHNHYDRDGYCDNPARGY